MNSATKTFCLLSALAVAGLAQAQSSNGGTTEIHANSGPVTVNWGQSSTLPNAAEYAVTIADLDSNGDGKISRAEAAPNGALSTEFKLVDRNHNGFITAAELANWH
jgi:hypothetical protein